MKTKYERKYIKFGLIAHYYRESNGLAQEAFAERVGISWSYLAKIKKSAKQSVSHS